MEGASFNELREIARLVEVPEFEIRQAYDKADLKAAIKQVDLRELAQRRGVPAADINMSYDRDDLIEAIRRRSESFRLHVVCEDGSIQNGFVDRELDIGALGYRLSLDATRGLSLTLGGEVLSTEATL